MSNKIIVTAKLIGFIETETPMLGDELEVEIDLDDISSDIQSYAEYELNMIEEDECECEISDFDDSELIIELDRRGYHSEIKEVLQLDDTDYGLLSDIQEKFHSLDWAGREKLHKIVLGI